MQLRHLARYFALKSQHNSLASWFQYIIERCKVTFFCTRLITLLLLNFSLNKTVNKNKGVNLCVLVWRISENSENQILDWDTGDITRPDKSEMVGLSKRG